MGQPKSHDLTSEIEVLGEAMPPEDTSEVEVLGEAVSPEDTSGSVLLIEVSGKSRRGQCCCRVFRAGLPLPDDSCGASRGELRAELASKEGR